MSDTLTLHHLEYSQSFRVLWMLEELQAPYDLLVYDRVSRKKEAPDPLQKMPVEMDPPKVLLFPHPQSIPWPEKLWALWSPSNPNGRPHGTYSSCCSDAPTSLTSDIITSRFDNTPATYGPPTKTITEQYEEEQMRLMNEKMRSKKKRRDERRKKAKTDMDTDKENTNSSDEDDDQDWAQKLTMKVMKKAMEAATPAAN